MPPRTRLLVACAALFTASVVITSCGDDSASPLEPNTEAGVDPTDSGVASRDVTTPDASAPDVASARCSPTSPFGAPVNVEPLNSPSLDLTPVLSQEELVVHLVSNRDGGTSFYDVLTARRATIASAFEAPSVVTELGTESNVAVAVSADGLTLVVERGVPPRLFVATRASPTSAWSTPLAWASSVDGDTMPSLTPDGAALYLVRSGKVHRAARSGMTYGAPSEIAWVTSPGEPIRPIATADELTLYFGDRPQGGGPFDIYVSRRSGVTQPWGSPALVAELASPVADWPSWISSDGCSLYFTSNRPLDDAGSPNHDVWMAVRGP